MSAQFGLSQLAPVSTGPAVGLPVARWETAYHRAVRFTDLVIVALALRIGLVFTDGSLQVVAPLPGAMASITGLVLVAALLARRVWDPRILGQGAEEFRRLGAAVLAATVVLGLTALAVDIGYLRPWVFVVLPSTGVALAVSRYTMRRVLHAQRRRDRCMLPVIAAGSHEEVADLIARTRRERHNGWSVVAACLPGGIGEDGCGEVEGVPVVGDLDDVADMVRLGGYRVVAVTPDPHWSRRRLRELAWQLEGAPVEFVVAPALMEVTGPRLHVTPVYGLTLLRVSQPTFSGGRWVLKATLDRVAAFVALLVLLPLLVAVTIAIKIEDRGPVFFRQTRVGKAGELFSMLKFRSMVVDAEAELASLQAANEGAGPLFKIRGDPRVTRVGTVLRRYSLDELPQLLNVLVGEMSMVGPRPPLPQEVERYGLDARRRLLVKPGLTGLWQVSGRSDLTWEETVRLDLRYVENWSMAMDAVIVWKTVSAVLRGQGAY